MVPMQEKAGWGMTQLLIEFDRPAAVGKTFTKRRRRASPQNRVGKLFPPVDSGWSVVFGGPFEHEWRRAEALYSHHLRGAST